MWWKRSRWRAVATIGEVATNHVMAVSLDGVELALGHDGEHYFAVQRRCPHRGSDLSTGMIVRGHLVCPQHGWQFSTETGRHSGLANACLDLYDVRVIGDQIEIDVASKRRAR